MKASLHIVSAQNSSPIQGIVQDGLISGFLLTARWETGPHTTFVPRKTFVSCMIGAGIGFHRLDNLLQRAYPHYKSSITQKGDDYFLNREIDGKLLLSLVLPEDLMYRKDTTAGLNYSRVTAVGKFGWIKNHSKQKLNGKKAFVVNEERVGEGLARKLVSVEVIFTQNSQSVWIPRENITLETEQVIIEKGVILPESGPITKNDIGSKSNSILHRIWKEYSPKRASEFLTEVQFLTDYWLPNHGFSVGVSDCMPTPEGKEAIQKTLGEVRVSTIQILKNYHLDPEQGEIDMQAELGNAGNIGLILAKKSMNKADRNSFNIMGDQKSGAKGSVVNLSQIVAIVGQQSIENKRIPLSISNKTRALSSFEIGDRSPQALGFVGNSFVQGLKPHEVWYHAATGREGVISTSLKTADTGYIQKKLGKKLENLTVYIDGTVRNSKNKIIQFLYGGDGFDAKRIYKVKGAKNPFFINITNLAKQLNLNAERDADEMIEEKRELAEEEINLLLSFVKAGSPYLQTPVIEKATEYYHKTLRDLFKGIKVYESVIPQLCLEIRDTLERSKVEYGAAVGLIATSSIGEITTQLTLNVFHLAGVRTKDVASGVPRFDELLATTRTSTPSCTIFVKYPEIDQLNRHLELLEISKEQGDISQEEYTTLRDDYNQKLYGIYNESSLNLIELRVRDLLETSKVLGVRGYADVDPSFRNPLNLTDIEYWKKEWWIDVYSGLGFVDEIEPEMWVIRLTFDMKKLIQYDLSLVDVAKLIESRSQSVDIVCVPSPDIFKTIDIFIKFSSIKGNISKSKVCKNLDIEEFNPDKRVLITTENHAHHITEKCILPLIEGFIISGVQHISDAFPLKMDGEWTISTKGSNLQQILSLDFVDKTRSTTNNVTDLLHTLGLEAARGLLVNEILLNFGQNAPGVRHVQLLADAMTYSGDIINVLETITIRKESPIQKILFQQHMANAVLASSFSEYDNLQSLSSSVMFGLGDRIEVGSSAVKVPSSRPHRTNNRGISSLQGIPERPVQIADSAAAVSSSSAASSSNTV